VPSSAIAYGWEAEVQLFAQEHDIKINSKEAYQNTKELMKLIDDIDELTAKKVDIALKQAKKRMRRDQLKIKLGWGRP
jgi:hypothetical protein